METVLPPTELVQAEASQTLQVERFDRLNLDDSFFDSLKGDYAKFAEWFNRKGDSKAYVFRDRCGQALEGFLYLKTEDGIVSDVQPTLPAAKRLKIGTFKINPHGTRLGERFLKRAFDTAIDTQVESLYVTVFEKHEALVQLFRKYGFKEVGKKVSSDGTELVLERQLNVVVGDVVLDYPRIPLKKNRHFILSIHPQWHSRLLPDSLLLTESSSILKDVSHTNSIHKIYLTRMTGIEELASKDTLVIYRTQDNGPGYYTSVVTSLGVVEEVVNISSFGSQDEFFRYCEPYSVFTREELGQFYATKKYPWLIRFTYNVALTKRVNRKALLEEVGLAANRYWGFFPITTKDLKKIVELSGDYEKTRSLIYTS